MNVCYKIKLNSIRLTEKLGIVFSGLWLVKQFIIIIRGFFVFIIILLIMIRTFKGIRLFTLYLFFERRLIPTSVLIIG